MEPLPRPLGKESLESYRLGGGGAEAEAPFLALWSPRPSGGLGHMPCSILELQKGRGYHGSSAEVGLGSLGGLSATYEGSLGRC